MILDICCITFDLVCRISYRFYFLLILKDLLVFVSSSFRLSFCFEDVNFFCLLSLGVNKTPNLRVIQ